MYLLKLKKSSSFSAAAVVVVTYERENSAKIGFFEQCICLLAHYDEAKIAFKKRCTKIARVSVLVARVTTNLVALFFGQS